MWKTWVPCFKGSGELNQLIGQWHVSNVEDMHDMFRDASLGLWNDMVGMFENAISFNQPIGQ